MDKLSIRQVPIMGTCRRVFRNLFPTCLLIVYFFVVSNIQMVMSRSVPTSYNSLDTEGSIKNNSMSKKFQEDLGNQNLEQLYPAQYGHHTYRHKRQLNYEMTLEEGQHSTMCSYDVRIDTNHRRIPENITRVECRNQGCVCSQAGHYKCTQLVTFVRAQIMDSGGASNDKPRYDVLKVPYACVCALRVSIGSKTVPDPELV